MSLTNGPSCTEEQQLAAHGYRPVLARKLSLKYLVAFGLNYLQPIGPALIFGMLMEASGGSVALPYLVAFIGMLFSLYSYVILSKKYPLSGALYSYVSNELGNYIGTIAGWLLILDYIFIPTITLVSASHYITAIFPQTNYEIVLIILTCLLAVINIVGIRFTAMISLLILAIEIFVVLLFLVFCTHWVVITPTVNLFSLAPFHISSTSALLSASAIAIFGYLGFDAISTLAEETYTPSKLVPRSMLVCLIIGGIIAFLSGYLGSLVAPSVSTLSAIDTYHLNSMLFYVTEIVSNHDFALIYAFTFIIAMIATNLVGTASAARLLFGMGRDQVRFLNLFSKVHPRFKTPYISILVISGICIIIGSLSSITQIAELINYGALSSFILLNISACYYIYKNKGLNISILIPAFGLIIMLILFLSLAKITLIFGSIWLVLGLLLYRRT